MKRSIATFLAFLWILTSVAQAQFILNELNGFNAGGEGPPPAFNFRSGLAAGFSATPAYTDTANAGSRNYATVDVGVDHSTRYSIITSESAGGTGDTAATICGVGATAIGNSGSTARSAYIWGAATGGLGTTCAVTVTHAGTPTAHSMSVYAAYPASVTAVDSSGANTASASPVALDVAKTNAGFTICSVETNNTASTISVAQTGAETVIEDADTDVEAGLSSGSYSHINTATTTTDDYTATISGTNGRGIICASWGP